MINTHKGNVLLVAKAKHIDKWKNALPEPVYLDASGPDGYVVWRY